MAVDRHARFALPPFIHLGDTMSTAIRANALIFAALTLCAVSSVGHAQQWKGSSEEKGVIWRSGLVTIGGEAATGQAERSVLDVKRALATGTSLDDLLFRANVAFKDEFFRPFEVDGHRAYAGGARNKSALLSSDFDFAVNRSAAIGVVDIDERIPS